jgi:hypothetical protein
VSTDLYVVKVVARAPKLVTLAVEVSSPDVDLPTDPSFFFRALLEGGKKGTLRKAVDADREFDDRWVEAHACEYISGVKQTAREDGKRRTATYEVEVTDARWLEGLKVRAKWDSVAYDSKARLPRGVRLDLLAAPKPPRNEKKSESTAAAPAGARRVSTANRGLRATVRSQDGTLAKVEWDIGPRKTVPVNQLAPLKSADDTYERAFRDPQGFFGELMKLKPLARAEKLEDISLASTGLSEIRLRPATDLAAPLLARLRPLDYREKPQPAQVKMNMDAPRLFALLRRLPGDTGVMNAIALLEGWLGDAENVGRYATPRKGKQMAEGQHVGTYTKRYANLLGAVSGALMLLVTEAWQGERFDSMSKRYPAASKRLRKILASLAERGVDTAWLEVSLERVPCAVSLKGHLPF